MAGTTVYMKHEEVSAEINRYSDRYELAINEGSDLEIFIAFKSLAGIRGFAEKILDLVVKEEEKERVRRAKLWKPSEDSIAEKGA